MIILKFVITRTRFYYLTWNSPYPELHWNHRRGIEVEKLLALQFRVVIVNSSAFGLGFGTRAEKRAAYCKKSPVATTRTSELHVACIRAHFYRCRSASPGNEKLRSIAHTFRYIKDARFVLSKHRSSLPHAKIHMVIPFYSWPTRLRLSMIIISQCFLPPFLRWIRKSS